MKPETTSRVNRALDFTEQRGGWWPLLAGALVGGSLAYAVLGFWIAWIPLGLGLVMFALRPAGTSARRRLLIRQARRMVAARKHQATR